MCGGVRENGSIRVPVGCAKQQGMTKNKVGSEGKITWLLGFYFHEHPEVTFLPSNCLIFNYLHFIFGDLSLWASLYCVTIFSFTAASTHPATTCASPL